MKTKFGLLALITVIATVLMPVQLMTEKNISLISNASAQAQTTQDRHAEALQLFYVGEQQCKQGQWREALETFEQALGVFRGLGDRQSEGTTLYMIGIVYDHLGQYPQALKYHKQALVIAKTVGNKAGEEQVLDGLGRIYGCLGQYSQALKYSSLAFAIAKTVGNKAAEGQALFSLGVAYSNLGQFPQGLNYYSQALVIAKKVGDKEVEEWTLDGIGGIYLHLRQYSQALKFLEQGLVFYKQVGNKAREADILHIIGRVYGDLGQYSQALKFLEQALVVYKQVGDKQRQGVALNHIAKAYERLRQYPNAEKTLFAALNVKESLRRQAGLTDADKVSIFETQADSYQFLQHVLVAQNKTNTALEIAERGRARAFVELLARRLSPPSATQLTFAPPTALQMQQIALAQNATLVQYSIIDTPLKVHGKEQWRERLFIWVIPPTGRIVFRWADIKPLLQQNTLLSESASNFPSVAPVAPNSPAVVTPTPESEQEIATPWSQPEVIILLILIGSSPIGITLWYGRFLLPKKLSQNTKLKQRWLVPSLLILLAAGGSGGLMFWMTQSQPIAQTPNLRNYSSLAQLVKSTREPIGTRERGLGIVPKGQQASQTNSFKLLHQLLIKPIADLLPANPNARIIFIPQSSLFRVPFPALQDEQGKYLIEKHTILTAPSIQVLDLTRQQKQRIGSKEWGVGRSFSEDGEDLVVGNPTMPSVPPQIGEPPQPLPSLPGAQEEAKAIAHLLKTQAITGNLATKASVVQKMSNARIVHLATHGLLDERRGLGSAIALAPNPNYQGKPGEVNGLLTAEEILNLKLNAELVVLSACDTGRGRITGDGVVGLSRSLISAGVPSVLVSLWSVPDAPTAFLMTEFYRNLQKNPDKAQALRQAMLTTMKQHPNPIDWAAFTLIGEAN